MYSYFKTDKKYIRRRMYIIHTHTHNAYSCARLIVIIFNGTSEKRVTKTRCIWRQRGRSVTFRNTSLVKSLNSSYHSTKRVELHGRPLQRGSLYSMYTKGRRATKNRTSAETVTYTSYDKRINKSFPVNRFCTCRVDSDSAQQWWDVKKKEKS